MFLSDELLQTIHDRAADYDKRNVFPQADYDDLKAAGYYKAGVPKEYGGFGLSLKEIAHEQTRLASAAPGTALGINMHQIIVGLGKYMVNHGNMKGEQILRDAADGKLLGFGISEPNNDKVLFGSICEAKPKENGAYAFYGPKVFISMAGAADKLVTYATDNTGESPKSVFGYIATGEGIKVNHDWDTLGMRATQSYSIELDGVTAEEPQILQILDPGPSTDPVVFGIFGNFEILLGATYFGVGKRALEVGIETVKTRRSVAADAMYDKDPQIRHRIAEAALALNTVQPQIDRIADDYENGADYGKFWFPKLSAVKNAAVESSVTAVEEIVRSAGGRSYYNDRELSRLFRDVYAGWFQPSDQESLHNAWANTLLGPAE